MKRLISFLLYATPLLAFSQVGGPVTFSGEDVKTGNKVSLSDFNNKSAVVVVFIGYKCPVDGYYKLRIKELVDRYSDRIAFVFVNSYLEPEEDVERMKMEAVANRYDAPYLADKEQNIMNALGARKSPEAFLLKPSGGEFVVVYGGAIDDNPQLPSGVKERYLNSAIENLLNDKPGTSSVRATGCTIRRR